MRSRPEAALQRTVVAYLAMALPDDAWFTAINPNPTKGKIAGAIAKSLGAKAGVPDICILWRGKTIFIELKAPKGSPSETQRDAMESIRAAGGGAYVCRSIGEVAMALAEWGIPCKARVAA